MSRTYGLWSWLYEEPLTQMDPPDWNWADFCGFRIGQILYQAGGRLPPEVKKALEEALFHASGSIYRRNMGPDYTNISIMGGLVTAMAGELLHDTRMLSYGVRRLKQAVDHHREQGGFNEYNSPTYTWVVLQDCRQALGCLKDPMARSHAEYLHQTAWEILATHFHPTTGQWAGPHSRGYALFLTPEVCQEIGHQAGVPIQCQPGIARKEFQFVKPPVGPGCPADLQERLRSLPKPEYHWSETFIKREEADASTIGTTWMHGEACLGSVNHDHFWDQRRLVLGYWNAPDKTAVVLRLRMLKDGKEFCSAYAINCQEGPRILSGIHFLLGRGDWHPVWGGSEQDIFMAEDLRLRYELRGSDLSAVELQSEEYLLASGGWGARLSPAPAMFDGKPANWSLNRGEGWVSLDCIAYSGVRREIRFRELGETFFGIGLELMRTGESGAVLSERDSKPGCQPIQSQTGVNGRVEFTYAGMRVTVPDRATPIPFL